jgi:predicted short-subunit dehydrogenase-like oxidoreductase (DUF2520 family)
VPEFQNIVFIGAGNVATHLAMAFMQAGRRIVQVYSRTEQSARQLAEDLHTDFTTDLNKLNQSADLYIISLTDEATQEFAEKLKLLSKPVVHTSGSLPMDLLRGISDNYGVLYPLQTFSKRRKVNFKEIPICVEANSTLMQQKLHQLASEISDHITEVDSERRKLLHLAAVFACNFPNYMYFLAGKIAEEGGFDFNILRPLIEETAGKVLKESPAEVQTGPAIRGDRAVMDMHMEGLKDKPALREIYALISREIGKMKKIGQ